MDYLDILILIPLVYGAWKGFSHGFIIEIAMLVGLVLGVYAAIRFSGYMEAFLNEFVNLSSAHLSYVALGVTFLLVLITVYLLGKLLTGMAETLAMGVMNKLLGTLFGILKYFVILCVLLLIWDALDDKFRFISEETKDNSLFFKPFLNFAQRIYHFVRY